jgi:hypothetical protein
LPVASINPADLVDLGEPLGVEVEVVAVEPFRSFSLTLVIAALTLLLPFSRASLTFFLVSALRFYPGFYIISIK